MGDIEIINAWLEHQDRERGRSTATLYSYSRMAKLLVAHLRGLGLSLGSASTDELRAWVHAPLTKGSRVGEEPSAATIKRKVSMLRSLFKFAHAEGLVDRDPSARLFAPKVRNENPKPVDLDVWRRLWRSDLSDADRVAFGLAMFCGLRRSEVVSVTAANFSDKMLSGFVRKGGRIGNVPWRSCVQLFFERDATLLDGDLNTFLQPLKRLIARDPEGASPLVPYHDGSSRVCEGAFFEGRIDPQYMNRRLERALRAVSLTGERAFTPHQLRHTFCTMLVEWEVPLLVVSRLAGHANVTVTERYTKTKEDPLEGLLGQSSDADEILDFARM